MKQLTTPQPADRRLYPLKSAMLKRRNPPVSLFLGDSAAQKEGNKVFRGPKTPGSPHPLNADRRLLRLWGLLRLLTWVWAIAVVGVTSSTALTVREQAILRWPPVPPYSEWVWRLLLDPFVRRDTIHYYAIVDQGYRVDTGSAQFHPLLAWLAAPLSWLSGEPMVGLFVVSSLASAGLTLAFYRLVQLDYPAPIAWRSTLLLFGSPLAFVLFIPYTEGLFLLCAVLCFYWMRQRHWWLAGLAGAGAVLTRQQGLFLLVPLFWEWVTAWRKPDHDPPARLRDGLALLLIPCGLVIWIAYRAIALDDVHVDLAQPQTLIYSLLISPSANKVVPQQAFLLPWNALAIALRKYWTAPEYSLLFDLVLGFGFIPLIIVTWHRMRRSEQLYTIVILIVSFGYYTGPHYPYMGLPRHLLLAVPVFVHLGAFFRTQRALASMIILGVLGMLFLQLQYGIHGWVP